MLKEEAPFCHLPLYSILFVDCLKTMHSRKIIEGGQRNELEQFYNQIAGSGTEGGRVGQDAEPAKYRGHIFKKILGHK